MPVKFEKNLKILLTADQDYNIDDAYLRNFLIDRIEDISISPGSVYIYNLFHPKSLDIIYYGENSVNIPYEKGVKKIRDLTKDDIGDFYDVIIEIGVIQHTHDPISCFENLGRVLNKNGIFIGNFAGNNFSGFSFYQFSPEILKNIFSSQNGFDAQIFLQAEDDKAIYEIDFDDDRQRFDATSGIRRLYIDVVAKKVKAVEKMRYSSQKFYSIESNSKAKLSKQGLIMRFTKKIVRPFLKPLMQQHRGYFRKYRKSAEIKF
jgi:SAM-dependent methyltransferase